jgi:hypothetical protein
VDFLFFSNEFPRVITMIIIIVIIENELARVKNK